MNTCNSNSIKLLFPLFGILLFIVCPLLFPTIGEQQNSYVQELCFTAFVWIALGYKWLQRKEPVTLRLLDIAIGICLFAPLAHAP